MKLRRLIIPFGFALAVTLSSLTDVFADSAISIFPSGSGDFTIRGNLLEKVATLEISVDYDTGSLSNPKAVCGPMASGAKCEIDTTTSGLVRIRISSATPLYGMGNLASVNFTRQGDDPGTINSIDAQLVDSDGTIVPAQTNVTNPSPDQAGGQQAALRRKIPPATASPWSVSAAQGGPVISAEPASVPGAVESRKGRRATEHPQGYRRLESVLDRFFGRPASVSLETLLALFVGAGVQDMRQDPPVALSDGASKVRLTVRAGGDAATTPQFIIRGGHCISLRYGRGNEWQIEVLPDKGVYAASLAVVFDGAVTEYPLTVAPPLEPARSCLGASDFDIWRRTRLRSKAAARPDYVEDYIYAANYLAKHGGVLNTEGRR